MLASSFLDQGEELVNLTNYGLVVPQCVILEVSHGPMWDVLRKCAYAHAQLKLRKFNYCACSWVLGAPFNWSEVDKYFLFVLYHQT